ncbi:MAG TPA: VOC family protein [Rhizomicrobium sp.]|jgi:catechol 2,3-dioxygenase-like lactoylglutathione lyase family enzyme
MIGYVTIGTNDFDRAKGFYGKVLAGFNPKPGLNNDRMYGWRTSGGGMLVVCKPYDGEKATAGNGTMVALNAPDRATVDKIHADALANGAKDEGAPGDRGNGFYGAYFRDLDDNKICIFKFG